MTLMDGDEMHRLWALVGDLTTQLNLNRQHLADVQSQVQLLKGQAVHHQTGFALRRFNVDISKEKFESELERLNAHLVQENNDLKWENKMNDRLIKEYEQCLEIVMKKFRTFSHATQTHTLKLTQHYEELLATNTHNAASASLHASTALSSTLSHLGSLVRSALREVEGEGEAALLEDEDTTSYLYPSSSTTSFKHLIGYGSSSDPRWYGSGGYTGKLGDPDAQRSDAALERSTELQRLRIENEELRKILDLSEGKGLDVGFGKEKLSLGLPRRGRKASMSQAGPTHAEFSTQQQQQQQEGGQQLQQPPIPKPRASSSRIPSIPAAPLPTATIPSPSASTTPVTSTPPPPPAQKPHRTPLREKLQQAAEAINSTSSPPRTNQTSVTAGLPTIPDILLGSNPESTIGAPGVSTLIPAPIDSAPAQSDIRSAPLLSISSPNGDGSSPADVQEEQQSASPRGEDAAEEALDLDDDRAEPDTTNAAESQERKVPWGSADLLLESKSGDEMVEVPILHQNEAEAPADEEIDLSDGDVGDPVGAVESTQGTVTESPPVEEAIEVPSANTVVENSDDQLEHSQEAASEVEPDAVGVSGENAEVVPVAEDEAVENVVEPVSEETPSMSVTDPATEGNAGEEGSTLVEETS